MDRRGTESDRDAWRHRATVAWAIVGMAAVFVLAVHALGLVGSAVELVVVGAIVGFVCSPITNSLEDRGAPRALAAFVALVVVCVVLVVVVVAFGSTFVTQSVEILTNVPAYARQVQEALGGFWERFGTAGTAEFQSVVDSVVASLSAAGSDFATQTASQITSGAVSGVLGIVDHSVTFFLALVLAFWLAKDYPTIIRELALVAGPEREGDLRLMLAVLSRSVGGYMRGQLITSVVNGVLVWLGLALLGHPYAGLLGMTTFVLHFVPVIGTFLSAALATVLALFSGVWLAVWTLIVMVVAANVTDNLISPLVMRSAVKIHPVLTLVGIVVGSELAGPVGMVLAIPLTAALKGAFVYYFETRTGRQIVSKDGALFESTPFVDDAGTPVPAFDALDDDAFFESTRLVDRGAPSPGTAPMPTREEAVSMPERGENREVAHSGAPDDARRGEENHEHV